MEKTDEKQTLQSQFPPNTKSTKTRVVIDNDIVEERTKRKRKARGMKVKKSSVQSFSQVFFGDDARNVFSYVLYDVLIPAAKTTIQDMISTGIEMLLFGGESPSRGRSRRDSRDGRSVVSYGSFYKGRDDERRGTSRKRFDLDNVVFKRGDEAGEVLEGLMDLLEEYEQVTVADFYDLAGVEGSTWADRKWGWEDLRKAYCTHTRGGYSIVFPRPIELD